MNYCKVLFIGREMNIGFHLRADQDRYVYMISSAEERCMTLKIFVLSAVIYPEQEVNPVPGITGYNLP
jgi:hypothetical protein